MKEWARRTPGEHPDIGCLAVARGAADWSTWWESPFDLKQTTARFVGLSVLSMILFGGTLSQNGFEWIRHLPATIDEHLVAVSVLPELYRSAIRNRAARRTGAWLL